MAMLMMNDVFRTHLGQPRGSAACFEVLLATPYPGHPVRRIPISIHCRGLLGPGMGARSKKDSTTATTSGSMIAWCMGTPKVCGFISVRIFIPGEAYSFH